jgi:hypothetical protein
MAVVDASALDPDAPYVVGLEYVVVVVALVPHCVIMILLVNDKGSG